MFFGSAVYWCSQRTRPCFYVLAGITICTAKPSFLCCLSCAPEGYMRNQRPQDPSNPMVPSHPPSRPGSGQLPCLIHAVSRRVLLPFKEHGSIQLLCCRRLCSRGSWSRWLHARTTSPSSTSCNASSKASQTSSTWPPWRP